MLASSTSFKLKNSTSLKCPVDWYFTYSSSPHYYYELFCRTLPLVTDPVLKHTLHHDKASSYDRNILGSFCPSNPNIHVEEITWFFLLQMLCVVIATSHRDTVLHATPTTKWLDAEDVPITSFLELPSAECPWPESLRSSGSEDGPAFASNFQIFYTS